MATMRVTRNLTEIAGALLVTFHGWLLVGQFLDGQLAQPYLLLRWVVAAGLVAGLVLIRRQGAEVFSRRAVAVWVPGALRGRQGGRFARFTDIAFGLRPAGALSPAASRRHSLLDRPPSRSLASFRSRDSNEASPQTAES